MKLYVIMGNDYPAGVMDDEEKAEKLCQKRMANQGKPARIYWRTYEFELNEVQS